jgi:hypothetical protein
MRARLLAVDDRATNEIIGFVLSFALSAIFLMIAMSTFWTAKSNSESVMTATEMKAVADRVASAVVEAGLVGQEFPNATMNISVPLPQQLSGHDYVVDAYNYGVILSAPDGAFSPVNATTFKLDAVSGLSVSGHAYSSTQRVIVSYTNSTGAASITVKNG